MLTAAGPAEGLLPTRATRARGGAERHWHRVLESHCRQILRGSSLELECRQIVRGSSLERAAALSTKAQADFVDDMPRAEYTAVRLRRVSASSRRPCMRPCASSFAGPLSPREGRLVRGLLECLASLVVFSELGGVGVEERVAGAGPAEGHEADRAQRPPGRTRRCSPGHVTTPCPVPPGRPARRPQGAVRWLAGALGWRWTQPGARARKAFG